MININIKNIHIFKRFKEPYYNITIDDLTTSKVEIINKLTSNS